MSLKIIVWNINSIRARIEILLNLLQEYSPDIVLLQEIKCENHNFPYDALSDFGYNIYLSGQKSYNGVAIFSKYVADEIKYDFTNNPDPSQARYIEISCNTNIGYSKFASIYVPNGGEIASDKFLYKIKFLEELKKYLSDINSFEEFIFLGGDYNVAPDTCDVYNPKLIDICCTDLEREKFRSIINSGFIDSYLLNLKKKEIKLENSHEFTWWDYRAGCFEKNLGMRIDHLLVNPVAADKLIDVEILRNYRQLDKTSDHAPILFSYN